MLTEAQVKAIILDNLADLRLQAINLFINKLIKRETDEVSIPIYRLKNTNTNTDITSLAEFYSAIDENNLVMNYNFNQKIDPDSYIHGFIVVLKNIKVSFDRSSQNDIGWIEHYGAQVNNLCFSLRYMNDADPILPLKITDVWLVK